MAEAHPCPMEAAEKPVDGRAEEREEEECGGVPDELRDCLHIEVIRRLRREWNGPRSGERLPEPGEHHKVGV